MKNFTINAKGSFSVDDAKIMWKNFAGAPDDFNDLGGKRSFTLVLEEKDGPEDVEAAMALKDFGYNIKERASEDENGTIDPATGEVKLWRYWTLNVGVGYNAQTGNGPDVFLVEGGKYTKLSENTIGLLDKIKTFNNSIDVYPYFWTRNAGKPSETSGIKACLSGAQFEKLVSSRFVENYERAMAADSYIPAEAPSEVPMYI